MFGCSHNWVLIQQSYTGPAYGVKVNLVTSEEMQRLAFGVTSLLYRCSKCTEPRIVEALGQLK